MAIISHTNIECSIHSVVGWEGEERKRSMYFWSSMRLWWITTHDQKEDDGADYWGHDGVWH